MTGDFSTLMDANPPLSPLEDKELSIRIQAGDEAARHLLWASTLRYAHRVASAIYAETVGRSTATLEDVFTAAAEALWDSSADFLPDGPAFKSFARLQMVWACRQVIRSYWIGVKAPPKGDRPVSEEFKDSMAGSTDGYEALEADSSRDLVLLEVRRLEPAVLEVFLLHYGFDSLPMNTEEIGLKLGLTRQAIHARLRKGWKALSLRSRLLR